MIDSFANLILNVMATNVIDKLLNRTILKE